MSESDEGKEGDESKSKKYKKSDGPIGALVIGAVVLAVVVGCNVMGDDGDSGGDPADDPETQAAGAQMACEGWVEDQLKAPSTAEFPREADISGSGPWTITSYVDAENSFGASLRYDWTCEVRLDGEYFRGSATLSE